MPGKTDRFISRLVIGAGLLIGALVPASALAHKHEIMVTLPPSGDAAACERAAEKAAGRDAVAQSVAWIDDAYTNTAKMQAMAGRFVERTIVETVDASAGACSATVLVQIDGAELEDAMVDAVDVGGRDIGILVHFSRDGEPVSLGASDVYLPTVAFQDALAQTGFETIPLGEMHKGFQSMQDAKRCAVTGGDFKFCYEDQGLVDSVLDLLDGLRQAYRDAGNPNMTFDTAPKFIRLWKGNLVAVGTLSTVLSPDGYAMTGTAAIEFYSVKDSGAAAAPFEKQFKINVHGARADAERAVINKLGDALARHAAQNLP